ELNRDLISGVIEPMGILQNNILSLLELCSDIIKMIPEDQEETPIVFEFKGIIRRLRETASFCEKFRNYSEFVDSVFWIERKKTNTGDLFERFVITPIEIASMMNETVFEQFKSVICTSATLTVKDNFKFWNSRIGLNFVNNERMTSNVFSSPFNYREQVLLAVPSDAPLPEEYDQYNKYISMITSKTLELSEGSALLLFTSYEMLKNVYREIYPILQKMGITAFRQGDDDRTRLLNKFRTDMSSVLFSTDSFWEGVDSPGEAFKLVIIYR
ncbi:MAG: hypothetical protein GY756_27800, partial [bacterium]|nr:hypothetical protein [bacterium]